MQKYIAIFLLVFLWSCQTKDSSRYILISKDSKQRIEHWLSEADSTLNIREFYTISTDSMDYFLQHSEGIVIGGGEDIHPSIYSKNEYLEVCGAIDLFRDSIEILLINYALENNIPLLGICRGHQIMNACTGGTLIPDIPSFINTTINHQCKLDTAHFVSVLESSWLNQLGLDSIAVNSRHHQCVDEVSPLFWAVSYSPDGIVESIQIKDSFGHPFAAGVQWHPESLLDVPSMKIANQFIGKVLQK